MVVVCRDGYSCDICNEKIIGFVKWILRRILRKGYMKSRVSEIKCTKNGKFKATEVFQIEVRSKFLVWI